MFRSLIFVPGNNERFLQRAKAIQADIICFDLEDSVPSNEKELARKMVAQALSSRQEETSSGRIYVRTNSPQSGLLAADLQAAASTELEGVVVPKVNDANEIAEITNQIIPLEKASGKRMAIMPSIETAKGVLNAYQIASANDRIVALVFGVFDFLYDMGLDYDEQSSAGYAYARAKIPVDARAAGVHSIDAIWQRIDDNEGLVRDAKSAKILGFSGKCVIHPSQIGPVHAIFRPSKSELDWARKVVGALGEAMEKGSGKGAVRLEGRMIDAVHYKQAKAMLDRENQA